MLMFADITLTSVLTDITSVATSMFTGVASVFNIIMEQPILFIAVAIPIVGAIVGFARRMFRVN